MIAAGRSPKAAAHEGPPTPASRSSQSRASCASRRPSARSAVEDGRLARVEGEREVPPQVGQLLRDRAEDAVVVEARLPDRHDPRVGRPGDDPRPALAVDLGRVVRVDPDRGVEPVEPIDAVERPARRRDVPARDEDPLDAGESGAAHDEIDVDLEPVSVEVAVAVDETHPGIVGPDAARSRRGLAVEPSAAGGGHDPRSRRRAAGRAAPDPRPGRPPRRGRPSRARRGSAGHSFPSGAYG